MMLVEKSAISSSSGAVNWAHPIYLGESFLIL